MAKDDQIFDNENLEKGLANISSLINKLNQADAELVNLSKNALAASKALGGINTPGGLGKSSGENAKTIAELEKLKKKYAELEERIKKLNEQRKISEKLSLQEKVDARIRLQNATAEAKARSSEADAYQKLAAALAAAQKEAQRIGATFGSDSIEFKKAADAVKKLDDEIKKIDAGIGKHQRNVGNYASGWNGLGNSINQITREAPAAAVSLSTFFLAISNNLPQFFDEITKLKVANEELVKSGEKPISIWKQLGTAVFSFQTLLSVGVTLLTLYGGKLIEMALGLGDVERQLKKVEEQQARYNHQLEDANRNIEHNLILEKNRRRLLGETEKDLIGLDKEAAKEKLKNYETTRDANKKLLDDRVDFLLKQKGLNGQGYEEEVNSQEKLNNEKRRLEKKLGADLVKYTYLARTEQEKADVESLAKINTKLLIAETLNQDEIFLKRKEGYIKANNEAVIYGQQVSELFSDLAVKQQEAEEDRLADLAEMNRKELELELAKNNALLEDEDAYYSDRISALNRDFAIRSKIAELDYKEEDRLAKNSYEKKRTALLNYQIEQLKLIQHYAKRRSDLEQLDLDPIIKLEDTDFRKDLLKPVIDSAKKAQKELEKYGKLLEKADNQTLKLAASTNTWLNSFSRDFIEKSGLGTINSYFDGTFKALLDGADGKNKWKVYFNGIAETAQETFNFITDLTAKNFDGEKTRLEEQYNVALKYAGDNKEAQEKLAQDLEARKKEIANREAKAKKKQAMFNIAIDTAQAVVAALPNYVLAGIIAALGAVQLAAVSAQEIPQYWMGGEHAGGLMMVNDGKGSNYRETIVTPDGNVHKPQGKNVIMDAPAGTKIFTHDQWLDEQKALSLQNMLKGKGIDMYAPIIQNQGMTKEDMYDVMSDTLGMQPRENFVLDGKGFRRYTQKGLNITNKNRNRANGKGRTFLS